MSKYTVAGVTYDSSTGRPISFDESYTGPKNALVGEVTSDAGVKYGVYADYNQENNEVQDSSGNVIANNISTINTGTVNVNSSVFNANDVQKVQNIMKTAEESNNVKSVDVSELHVGVYILEILDGDIKYSQKVQIAR